MCHNPAHRRQARRTRMKSCADAGCHADWRSVAFHAGKAHRKVAEQCRTCHQPHAARVDASDCTGCHTAVRKGGRRSKPPLPFDTLKALRQSLLPVEPGPTAERRSSQPGRAGALPGARRRAASRRATREADQPTRRLSPTPSPIELIADSPASPATRTSSPTSDAHLPAAARLPDLPSPAPDQERTAPRATRPRRSSRHDRSPSR